MHACMHVLMCAMHMDVNWLPLFHSYLDFGLVEYECVTWVVQNRWSDFMRTIKTGKCANVCVQIIMPHCVLIYGCMHMQNMTIHFWPHIFCDVVGACIFPHAHASYLFEKHVELTAHSFTSKLKFGSHLHTLHMGHSWCWICLWNHVCVFLFVLNICCSISRNGTNLIYTMQF